MTTTEYAFELANGHWQHRCTSDFRNEQHAKDWAKLCGIIYKGKFTTQINENAPGSASWCETYGDNR